MRDGSGAKIPIVCACQSERARQNFPERSLSLTATLGKSAKPDERSALLSTREASVKTIGPCRTRVTRSLSLRRTHSDGLPLGIIASSRTSLECPSLLQGYNIASVAHTTLSVTSSRTATTLSGTPLATQHARPTRCSIETMPSNP